MTDISVKEVNVPKPLEITARDMASTWKLWLQQFEWYATAVGLEKKPAKVQAAVLMNVIGPEAAIIYNTFNLPDTQANDISKIKEKFYMHFAPKPCLFTTQKQKKNEKFGKWYSEKPDKFKGGGYTRAIKLWYSEKPDKFKGGGYTRAIKLSPKLAAIVGAERMPLHEVVKKVQSIIEERNLYDSKNKQFAICDDELMNVIGVMRFRHLGVIRYLQNHFVD